jgi:heme-degrading monooxygenase HmoA
MFARATQFEIDTLRITIEDAQRLFNEQVMPLVEHQPGFLGLYVMVTPEGKGMVLSLWRNEPAALSGIESGYYEQQVSKFITFMRQPPGREHYEVIHAQIAPEAVSIKNGS